MPNQQLALNEVFSALSDPTRRAVLVKLGRGSAPVSDLAKPFDMALPSFTQHLRVLEECGLVRSKKQGRKRIYGLVPRKFRVAEQWLEKQHAVWEQRLDGLDAYLAELKSTQEGKV